MDDYIHRIGRTGRIGQKVKQLPLLIEEKLRFLDSQNQRVPNWLRELIKSNGNEKKFY